MVMSIPTSGTHQDELLTVNIENKTFLPGGAPRAAINPLLLGREEGIWVGNSGGSAIAGLLQLKDNFKTGELVVVIFHDHGTRYLGKMFNPEWMRMMGYQNLGGPTARDLVKNKNVTDLVGVVVTDSVEQAVLRMRENDFSQIPITQESRIVGSLSEPQHG